MSCTAVILFVFLHMCCVVRMDRMTNPSMSFPLSLAHTFHQLLDGIHNILNDPLHSASTVCSVYDYVLFPCCQVLVAYSFYSLSVVESVLRVIRVLLHRC